MFLLAVKTPLLPHSERAQSEAAKEFLRLKETLTQTDVSLMVAEIKTAKKDWDNKQAQLAKFNLELGKLSECLLQFFRKI